MNGHLVFVTRLAESVEETARNLAPGLGVTAYELRLTLNAGLPAVVQATVDADAAERTRAAVSRSGHQVVVLDGSQCVRSRDMTALRQLQFLPQGISPRADSPQLFPYAELRALVRATHRTTKQTTETLKERKFDPTKAALTGGLLLSKKTTREVTTRSEERQQVLYVFGPHGAAPWILRERETHYGGLGKELGPASIGNFMTCIRWLRERAPQATYDERLLTPRPLRGVAEGIEAVDLVAYAIACSS